MVMNLQDGDGSLIGEELQEQAGDRMIHSPALSIGQ
jgi:hypothetical protein